MRRCGTCFAEVRGLGLAILLAALTGCDGEGLGPVRQVACAGDPEAVLGTLAATARPNVPWDVELVRLRYAAWARATLGQGRKLEATLAAHEQALQGSPEEVPLEFSLDFADIAHRRLPMPGTERLLQRILARLSSHDDLSGDEPAELGIPGCVRARRTAAQATALAHLRIGTGHLQRTEFAKAREHYDRGLLIMAQSTGAEVAIAGRSFHALLYNNRAELALEQGRGARALSDRRRAIEIAREAAADRTLALARAGLAFSALRVEVPQADLAFFADAARTTRTALERGADTGPDPVLLGKLATVQGLLHARQHGPAGKDRVAALLQPAKAMLGDPRASRYDKLGVLYRMGAALFESGNWPRARNAHERALNLLVQLWQQGADADRRRATLALYEDVVATALQQAVVHDDTALALLAMERSKDVGLLQRYRRPDTTEGLVAGDVLPPPPRPVSEATLSARLAPNQAFVHLDRAGADRIWLVVRADGATLVRRRQQRTTTAAGGNSEAPAQRMARLRALHRDWIEPIEGALEGVDQLLIAGRAELHALAWPALIEPDGHRLVERYAVTLVPSATQWLSLIERPTPPAERVPVTMLVASSHLDPEALRRAAGLPAHVPVLERASQLNGVAAELLAVAAHGTFLPGEPASSYLQLLPTLQDPGRLSVHALANSNLNVETVFLHACDSARTRATAGDELDSLVRGFLAGGARAVLAPLGPLSAAHSERVWRDVTPLLRVGVAPADALAQTQRRMLAQHRADGNAGDPFEGGVFVASGAAFVSRTGGP